MTLVRASNLLALAVCLAWLAAALAAGALADVSQAINLERILAAPDRLARLGCDDLGRPVAARLIAGARTSLLVALSVAGCAMLVGTSVGLVAGWVGGWVDLVIMRLVDVVLAFPGLLLAIALAAVLGPGLVNLVLALVLVSWVSFARLARAQTLTLRQAGHVEAARAFAVPVPRILLRHVVPLMAAPLIVELTFAFAAVILAEASLSFLGLGVQPPEASWGNMIRDGKDFLLVAPHIVMAPGVAMALTVLALNLLGDRLRDRLDVALRQTSDGQSA